MMLHMKNLELGDFQLLYAILEFPLKYRQSCSLRNPRGPSLAQPAPAEDVPLKCHQPVLLHVGRVQQLQDGLK